MRGCRHGEVGFGAVRRGCGVLQVSLESWEAGGRFFIEFSKYALSPTVQAILFPGELGFWKESVVSMVFVVVIFC